MSRFDDNPGCEEVLDLLEPYLDGDLPPDEAARVAAHLERCPACAGERDLAAAVQRELRALPQHECPPEVLQKIRNAGAGEVVPFRPRLAGWPVRLSLAAAVLALTVGGAAFFLQQRQDGPSPAEIAQATEEARFALAYIGKVNRKASLGLRDEVLRRRLVAPATRSLAQTLEDIPGTAPETRGAAGQP